MRKYWAIFAVAALVGACRGEQNDRAQPEQTAPAQGQAQQADPNAVGRRGLDQGQDTSATNVPGAQNPGGLAGNGRAGAPPSPGTMGNNGNATGNNGPNAVNAAPSAVVPPPPNQPGATPNPRDGTQLQGEIQPHGSPAQKR